MENFMDKLAEKFSPQDIIKANSQAEMAEAQRIKKEAEHYRREIEELRKHAAEYSQQLEQLEELMEASRDYTEEFEKVINRIHESDSKTHDVGVQIYRNVQKRTGRADCPRGSKAAPHWKESGLRAREKWKSRSDKAGQENYYPEAGSC